MSVLPATKYFRVVKGATFDYSFQYLTGIPDDAVPFDLTGYTGTWTLHLPGGGTTTYSTGASAGQSGVFFGGNTNNLTTGIIDLVISSTNTASINWTTIPYTFSIRSPDVTPIITPLLTGALSVILTLP